MQPNGWPRAAVAFVVAHVVCVSNPEFQLYEHVRGVKIKQQKEKTQQVARLMIRRLPCLANMIGIFDTCASQNLLRAQAKPESATWVSDFLRLVTGAFPHLTAPTQTLHQLHHAANSGQKQAKVHLGATFPVP